MAPGIMIGENWWSSAAAGTLCGCNASSSPLAPLSFFIFCSIARNQSPDLNVSLEMQAKEMDRNGPLIYSILQLAILVQATKKDGFWMPKNDALLTKRAPHSQPLD
jgi:hypothetical protein